MGRGKGLGVLALLGTVTLWGSSFPAIKVVVTHVSPLTYVWLRALIACLGLTPYVVYAAVKGSVKDSIKGGLVTGVAFALGLWLQGWGTKYTSASNSAFITGLNVVFVHLYVGIIRRDYRPEHAAGLALSIAGLYLLTRPEGGFGLGDMLVLGSAVMWAAQVLLVDRFSGLNPLVLTWAEMIPSISFVMPDLIFNHSLRIPAPVIPYITYLGLACADGAFTLQVVGQRRVDPASAAIIFLLEPVIAAALSTVFLHELIGPEKAAGMALILSAIIASQLRLLRRSRPGRAD